MDGRTVQILIAQENHTFELDVPALESILLRNEVKDLPVVVLAAVGTFRKGKSFLLNFFLRYLESKGADNWEGSPDLPLEGFPWRGGSERETTGIVMWSNPFVVELPNGQKVAVLLMDMQGVFDEKTTMKECATVFSLGALLSSMLIYNLQADIHEDNLQALQMFADYGKVVQEENAGIPFQKLLFLIRDWPNAYEMPYGTVGGKMLLEKRFKVSSNQAEELQEIRHHIRSIFTHVSCFLMPHPGMMVLSNPHFQGKLKDIEPQFVESLNKLLPLILAPKNLVVKKIGDIQLKCSDFVDYFKTYVDIFKNNTLPQPETIFEATSNVHHLLAVMKARTDYYSMMSIVHDEMKVEDAERVYRGARDFALKTFDAVPKMGNSKHHRKYRADLDEEMETNFNRMKVRIVEKQTLEKELSSLISTYESKMKLICESSALRNENLNGQHLEVKSDVCKSFAEKTKNTKKENQEKYMRKLNEAIEEKYALFRERNNSKLTHADHERRVREEEAARRAEAVSRSQCFLEVSLPPGTCSQPVSHFDDFSREFSKLNVSGPSPAPIAGVTKKHVNFLSQSVSTSPVTALPGVGKVLGSRLQSNGIDSVSSMMQQYRACRGNPERFQSWMRDACGADSRRSMDCYNALSAKSSSGTCSGGRTGRSGGRGFGGRRC